MNRYALTAKSLITNSRLVQAVLLILGAACLLLTINGQASPTVIFLAILLSGVGYTTRTYLPSERRRLVPGMNETSAGIAIAFLFVAWLISLALIFGLHGLSPELAGGCFCGLALALWVGCLEPSAAPILLLPYLLPMIAFGFRDETEKWFSSYTTLSPAVHMMVGGALFAIGLAVAARYWFVITSKYSPFVYQRTNVAKQPVAQWKAALLALVVLATVLAFPATNIISHFGIQRSFGDWSQTIGKTAMDTLIAFAICGLLYALWRGLIQYCSPAKRSLTELGHFLFGAGKAHKWSMLPWIMGFVFIASIASTKVIVGSETDEAINAKIGLGLLIGPFIASTFLMHGIPKLLSKLWLTGISDSRNDTAKVLLLAVMAHTLPAALVAVAGMLTLSMSTTLGPTPVLIVSMLCIAIGSINIWFVTKLYPFIARHAGIFALVYVVIAFTATTCSVTFAHRLILHVSTIVDDVGPWISLLSAFALSTGISALCVWDASRSVGASSRMMETSDAFVLLHTHTH